MRHISFITIISFFLSCSSKDKIPHDILTVNQMKPVLWDIIKAEELAAYDTIKEKNISVKDSATDFFNKVFAMHHVSKNTFYTSYDYYLHTPQKLTVLMDSVSAFANRDRYSQYMKPPVIPGSQNPAYNKMVAEKILHPALLNKRLGKRDSALKKISVP